MTLLILVFTTGFLLGGLAMAGIFNLLQKKEEPVVMSSPQIDEMLALLAEENGKAEETLDKLHLLVRQNVKQDSLNDVGGSGFSDDLRITPEHLAAVNAQAKAEFDERIASGEPLLDGDYSEGWRT